MSLLRPLKNALESDRRLNVTVLNEKEYYDAQTVSAAPYSFSASSSASLWRSGVALPR